MNKPIALAIVLLCGAPLTTQAQDAAPTGWTGTGELGLALEIVDVPPLQERFPDVVAYLDSQLLGEVSALEALQPDALELLRK